MQSTYKSENVLKLSTLYKSDMVNKSIIDNLRKYSTFKTLSNVMFYFKVISISLFIILKIKWQ